jgi:hypothetical protein
LNGVAIGVRTHGPCRANGTASAADVLDYELLSERARHVLSDNADDYVARPARGKWHDHGNGPRRIGLRPREARHGRQCRSARGQLQKSAAGKFHVALFWIIRHSQYEIYRIFCRLCRT